MSESEIEQRRDKGGRWRGGRGRGGGGRGRQHSQNKESGKESVDESSPIIQAFRIFQKELDAKHDKHERLVKLSRDITIESKRIIFLLQRVTGSSTNEAAKLFTEAETRISELQKTKWKSVASELHNEDPHQFLRAYSAGLQEYVEAVSFWFYLKNNNLISWQQIHEDLVFTGGVSQNDENNPEEKLSKVENCHSNETNDEGDKGNIDSKIKTGEQFEVYIPPEEYMLGIADLTGEIMRLAINAVGQGKLDEPTKICGFMRCIYEAFVSYGNVSKELNRKLFTLKQSLSKVETACYTLQVRGSEVPKHILADVIRSSASQDYSTDVNGE